MDGSPIQARVSIIISVSMQSVADTVTTPMDRESIQVRVQFIVSVSMQSVADTVTKPMDGKPIQVCVSLVISVGMQNCPMNREPMFLKRKEKKVARTLSFIYF